jgi:hypothetical protein
VSFLAAEGQSQPAEITRSLADYRLANRDWNGLSFFDALARSNGWTWRGDAGSLDHGQSAEGLSPENGILCVIFPESPIDPRPILNWVEEGGALFIADDFGRSESLLGAIGLSRHDVPVGPNARLRSGNPAFQYLEPGGEHSLTEGVRSILTNHAAAFRHDRKGLFPFSDQRFFLYDLTLGEGRILAASDPSVLINAMIPAADNEALIRNITDELCGSIACPALFVSGEEARTFDPATALGGGRRTDPRSTDWFSEVRLFVESFSSLELGETGRRILTIALGLILMMMLFFGFPMLQQRSSMKRGSGVTVRTRRDRLERQLSQLRTRDSGSAVPVRLVEALEDVFLDDLRACFGIESRERGEVLEQARARGAERSIRLLNPIVDTFDRVRAERAAGRSSGSRTAQTVSAERFDELCEQLHRWTQFTSVNSDDGSHEG